MNRKQELEIIINESKEELFALIKAENDKKAKNYIGNYYKGTNSYSCPQPNEYWFYYMAPIEINEDGLRGITFQTDYRGRIEIEDGFIADILIEKAAEISKQEWLNAWINLVNKVNQSFIDVLSVER